SRVRSSRVGPRPPVDRTSPARCVARPNTVRLSWRSSATVVCRCAGMPISASRRASHWKLVSRFCPLVISLPIEMISAFIVSLESARGVLRFSEYTGVVNCPRDPERAVEYIKITALCVAATVLYGICHDQVTARVCVEYFTVGHPPVFGGLTDPTLLAF